jgi:hypothetical protein
VLAVLTVLAVPKVQVLLYEAEKVVRSAPQDEAQIYDR